MIFFDQDRWDDMNWYDIFVSCLECSMCTYLVRRHPQKVFFWGLPWFPGVFEVVFISWIWPVLWWVSENYCMCLNVPKHVMQWRWTSTKRCKDTYPYSILASAMDNPVRGTGIYKHVTFTVQFDRRYMPLFTIASMNIRIHISMNVSTLLAASSPVWKASLWDGKLGKGHMKSLKLL